VTEGQRPSRGSDRRNHHGGKGDEHLPHQSHMHVHLRGCGHERVPHGDHDDFVHGEHRHAPHGTHYDEH
jgi:zinc transport system permease protein